mmetsp:Transcript_410/g.806  ORF Transcript_410/g.806 Transcript_410/m.806 type:complete len:128 (-) Transcript_410:801-1184(-)
MVGPIPLPPTSGKTILRIEITMDLGGVQHTNNKAIRPCQNFAFNIFQNKSHHFWEADLWEAADPSSFTSLQKCAIPRLFLHRIPLLHRLRTNPTIRHSGQYTPKFPLPPLRLLGALLRLLGATLPLE